MVAVFTESGDAATQPCNALMCGGSLGYSVCGVSQPFNARVAHVLSIGAWLFGLHRTTAPATMAL